MQNNDRRSSDGLSDDAQRRLAQVIDTLMDAHRRRIYGVVEVHLQAGTMVRTKTSHTTEVK